MPALAFCLAALVFHLSPLEIVAATVIAALPTAQKIYGYAARYERGEALVRDVILLTTAAAVPVIIAIALVLHPGRG
jgi:predicted permease